MARNRYAGYCYCCGEYTPVGYGRFERRKNTDKEVKRAIKLTK